MQEQNKSKELKELNEQKRSGFKFAKYTIKPLKEKLYQAEDVTDIQLLSPIEKAIIIHENMLENALLLQTLFPDKKIDEAEKLFLQAKAYFNSFLKPFLKLNGLNYDLEQEKIKKLEEALKNMDISLEDLEDFGENK